MRAIVKARLALPKHGAYRKYYSDLENKAKEKQRGNEHTRYNQCVHGADWWQRDHPLRNKARIAEAKTWVYLCFEECQPKKQHQSGDGKGKKLYRCQVSGCGKVFVAEGRLRMHARSHVGGPASDTSKSAAKITNCCDDESGHCGLMQRAWIKAKETKAPRPGKGGGGPATPREGGRGPGDPRANQANPTADES